MYWPYDPEHPVTKVCTTCGVEKHLMEFYLRYENGRRLARCKVCVRAQQGKYRAANAERVRAAKRRYHAANAEEINARRRQFYAAHAAEQRAAMRRYYAADPGRNRAAAREWRRRNRDRLREHQRTYRRRHPRKVMVRQATRLLRDLGLIERPERCEDCGGKAREHHHLNYDNPFAVVSLCRRCHTERHYAVWRREGGGPVKYPEEYGGVGVWEWGIGKAGGGGRKAEGRGERVRVWQRQSAGAWEGRAKCNIE